MLTKSSKEEIIQSLNTKVDSFSCPFCGQKEFTLVDGYLLDIVHNDFNSPQLLGKTLPSVSLVCNNCGFIAKFALGALGLMNNEPDIKEKEEPPVDVE